MNIYPVDIETIILCFSNWDEYCKIYDFYNIHPNFKRLTKEQPHIDDYILCDITYLKNINMIHLELYKYFFKNTRLDSIALINLAIHHNNIQIVIFLHNNGIQYSLRSVY